MRSPSTVRNTNGDLLALGDDGQENMQGTLYTVSGDGDDVAARGSVANVGDADGDAENAAGSLGSVADARQEENTLGSLGSLPSSKAQTFGALLGSTSADDANVHGVLESAPTAAAPAPAALTPSRPSPDSGAGALRSMDQYYDSLPVHEHDANKHLKSSPPSVSSSSSSSSKDEDLVRLVRPDPSIKSADADEEWGKKAASMDAAIRLYHSQGDAALEKALHTQVAKVEADAAGKGDGANLKADMEREAQLIADIKEAEAAREKILHPKQRLSFSGPFGVPPDTPTDGFLDKNQHQISRTYTPYHDTYSDFNPRPEHSVMVNFKGKKTQGLSFAGPFGIPRDTPTDKFLDKNNQEYSAFYHPYHDTYSDFNPRPERSVMVNFKGKKTQQLRMEGRGETPAIRRTVAGLKKAINLAEAKQKQLRGAAASGKGKVQQLSFAGPFGIPRDTPTDKFLDKNNQEYSAFYHPYHDTYSDFNPRPERSVMVNFGAAAKDRRTEQLAMTATAKKGTGPGSAAGGGEKEGLDARAHGVEEAVKGIRASVERKSSELGVAEGELVNAQKMIHSVLGDIRKVPAGAAAKEATQVGSAWKWLDEKIVGRGGEQQKLVSVKGGAHPSFFKKVAAEAVRAAPAKVAPKAVHAEAATVDNKLVAGASKAKSVRGTQLTGRAGEVFGLAMCSVLGVACS